MSSTSKVSPQSLNLYSYTQNNPIDYTDPSGLNEEAPIDGGTTYAPYWDWGFWWWVMFGRRNNTGGGGVSIETGGGGGQQQEQTPCSRMADRLENFINQIFGDAINQFGLPALLLGVTHEQLDEFKDLLDEDFSTFYMVRRLASIDDAWALSPFGGGPTISPLPFSGQGGFQQQFREGENLANDQTHHFAAYFSSGVNGMSLTSTIHYLLDDNDPDRDLGNAAWDLGSSLNMRTEGSIIVSKESAGTRLRRILDLPIAVRTNICDPPPQNQPQN